MSKLAFMQAVWPEVLGRSWMFSPRPVGFVAWLTYFRALLWI